MLHVLFNVAVGVCMISNMLVHSYFYLLSPALVQHICGYVAFAVMVVAHVACMHHSSHCYTSSRVTVKKLCPYHIDLPYSGIIRLLSWLLFGDWLHNLLLDLLSHVTLHKRINTATILLDVNFVAHSLGALFVIRTRCLFASSVGLGFDMLFAWVASFRLSACLDEKHYVGFIASAMFSAIVTHQLSA